jgi:hypothetical protein
LKCINHNETRIFLYPFEGSVALLPTWRSLALQVLHLAAAGSNIRETNLRIAGN